MELLEQRLRNSLGVNAPEDTLDCLDRWVSHQLPHDLWELFAAEAAFIEKPTQKTCRAYLRVVESILDREEALGRCA